MIVGTHYCRRGRAVDLQGKCSHCWSHRNPVTHSSVQLRGPGWGTCNAVDHPPFASMTVLTGLQSMSLPIPHQLCLSLAPSPNLSHVARPKTALFLFSHYMLMAVNAMCMLISPRAMPPVLSSWLRDLLGFSFRLLCGHLKPNCAPHSLSQRVRPPLTPHPTREPSQKMVAAINFSATWNSRPLDPINFKSEINLHPHSSPILAHDNYLCLASRFYQFRVTTEIFFWAISPSCPPQSTPYPASIIWQNNRRIEQKFSRKHPKTLPFSYFVTKRPWTMKLMMFTATYLQGSFQNPFFLISDKCLFFYSTVYS